MIKLIQIIDKAGGYVFGIKNQNDMASMMSCAAGADFEYFAYPFYLENRISSIAAHGVYLLKVLWRRGLIKLTLRVRSSARWGFFRI